MNKNNWTIKTIECGWKEYVKIDVIGLVKAKFDTGNGNACVIHADDWTEKDGLIIWKIGDFKLKNESFGLKDVRVGGLRDHIEKRPVIKLDISFNGETFKQIEFILADRSKRTPILINRLFIKKAGLSINPAKQYILSSEDN